MKWYSVVLIDTEGQELFNGHIHKLPLSEKNIKSESIRYFDDEEPCFIHRSAVLNRIYNELNDFFMQIDTSGGIITINNLPAKIRQFLDIFGTAETIILDTKK